MSDISRVIVIGATGIIGPCIVRALSDADFQVSVLTRETPDGSDRKFGLSSFGSNIKIVSTDYSQESLIEALAGQDAVISTVGFAGIAAQKNIIDAAITVGVKRFIPSEYGGDGRKSLDDLLPQLRMIFKGKKDILDYLINNEAKISWTGIGTGPFLDWALGISAFGFDIKNHTATIFDDGATPFTGTVTPRIATAVVEVLRHPDQTKNRWLNIRSVKTTQKELLAALELYTKTKWTVSQAETDELYSMAQQKMKEGDFKSARRGLLARNNFERGNHGRGIIANDGEEGMNILGFDDETLEDVIRAAEVWNA